MIWPARRPNRHKLCVPPSSSLRADPVPIVPGEEAELAAIHAEFAGEVLYSGAGLDGDPVHAVMSETPADAFTGPGETLREISFEIPFSALSEDPDKGDMLLETDGTEWRVIDVTRRRDINAWVLIAEIA